MTILAFDTTHGFCSVALLKNNKIVAQKNIDEISKQAEQLVCLVEDVLRESKLTYPQVKTIACTVGPGSFTGVRIGLAAAHGFLLATEATFFGVSALEAIAWQAREQLTTHKTRPICSILDARRGEVYLQCFDSSDLTPTTSAQLCTLSDALMLINEGEYTLTGNAMPLIEKELHTTHQLISPEALPNATLVAQVAAWKMAKSKEGFAASPLYIRKPDATLPKAKLTNVSK